MTTLTKTCTKCGIELPATTEYFSPVKNVKCGLRGKCKRCVAQESRERYHADPEKREKAKASAQNGKCWWCGKDVGDTYHVDHLIPLARGGTNKPNNIVIACPFCNQSKHDKLPHEWCGRLF